MIAVGTIDQTVSKPETEQQTHKQQKTMSAYKQRAAPWLVWTGVAPEAAQLVEAADALAVDDRLASRRLY